MFVADRLELFHCDAEVPDCGRQIAGGRMDQAEVVACGSGTVRVSELAPQRAATFAVPLRVVVTAALQLECTEALVGTSG
jgi:hypothetical protein